MSEGNTVEYTSQDIRFTTKGNVLYAISFDWSNDGVVIKSLSNNNPQNLKVTSISMLGCDEKIGVETDRRRFESEVPVR